MASEAVGQAAHAVLAGNSETSEVESKSAEQGGAGRYEKFRLDLVVSARCTRQAASKCIAP